MPAQFNSALLASIWPTHAMPLMICVLCAMAIAYRYYSAFLAAKVAALDDSRVTPAVAMEDGENYQPTNKWVLFGHHFAAISGAGPLIGPVLAAQFGYMPGILWIVIGVCLGGAAQDFLVMAASIRRGGKSLAQIARQDVGKWAGGAAGVAILFILVIALAGLGKVVVKALGGETVRYPAGSKLVVTSVKEIHDNADAHSYEIGPGSDLIWNNGQNSTHLQEGFLLRSPSPLKVVDGVIALTTPNPDNPKQAQAARIQRGSIWGTFTIACTIPIALFVGLYMYKIRKGKIVEASIIGGALTLGVTFAGNWVAHQSWGGIFNLTDTQVTWSMAVYGFVAAVLPVWVLLVPRDYLSSFLKIGTIALLVIGTLIANPKMEAPAFNHIFQHGGPIVPGDIFPFLFITIMCGAISGFHALVSSGTTPKMIRRESDARMIGYGAMLMEGLVAVVAMVAAATLPSADYYAMNTDLNNVPAFQAQIAKVSGNQGDHLQDYEASMEESLRGRTGGAVTLAVGMSHIFDQAAGRMWVGSQKKLESLLKFWFHFAIMFEALFILTTIDAGTRIGRFLLQEMAGHLHPKLGQTNWKPGTVISTALIVLGWVYFIQSGSMRDIWPMFGISNQMLAVIALAIVSAYLANEGRAKYLWATLIPMLVVATTTTTAGVEMLGKQFIGISTLIQARHEPGAAIFWPMVHQAIQSGLIIAMLACGAIIVIASMRKIYRVISAGSKSPDLPAMEMMNFGR
ncbi:MAG TPA: carbon starvation protein A [Tepidisphaeraceae bacterium]|nr:carbon starvation protein A [Tepidisphaeraceae bacterium]